MKRHNLLKEIVKTRAVLKEKLKNIKLNQIDRDNLLEDTFQPITKPLKDIIGKLDENKKESNQYSNKYNDKNIYDYNKQYEDDGKLDKNNKDDDDDDDSFISDIYNDDDDYMSSNGLQMRDITSSNDNERYNNQHSSTIFPNIVNSTHKEDNSEIEQMDIEKFSQKRKFSSDENNTNKRIRKNYNIPVDLKRKDYTLEKCGVNRNELREKLKRSNDNNLSLFDDNDNKRMKKSHLFSKRKCEFQLNTNKKRIKLTNNKIININKRKRPSQLNTDRKRLKLINNNQLNLNKRKGVSQLNLDRKRIKLNNDISSKLNKRKAVTQLNIDRKRIKLSSDNLSDINVASSLPNVLQTLIDNRQLDKVYGFHIDTNGNMYFGKNQLKFNGCNSIQIGESIWKMSPGLFQLMFHIKPQHYTKKDLNQYKDILMKTNAHKRNYLPGEQIKGTQAYKYQFIIKRLFDVNSNRISKGNGLSLKSLDNHKPNYIYWDDPNELVDRLRLLLSSEGVGHNNHKNEIISIVEELREAHIIK
ncbi:MATH and LRR domain-containing protein PFE0570w-like [Stomoxys calcitrans]|uniref:MATH and LRR domain-containing protein PFE0570w-like n=1 Tax=Stomoxys calcitrans TaxID=35570 RepID=UPI0027E27589|nr:MATH and LRR domain-containing protein PFE0570w-like [Stomoxys calcitrans]XP_059217018.1 MATH and LRR domain-containing protein PFE0570w-like [Stomoxys calcitrans]XP_059223612.1 MATH and LRR domain-containing protein PFE0570w-like [Stomoxys calcitrans]XP_059223613.1 MATH and LRR domain-containing protein PFE0570w-like [Stomoxys calcitrans]XP_059224577.1 MATH and LRR domain-containing protein PFE0570w-like [Stomoxys calcitrans]XP_059224606.1 MATH and LRR domain-containing protein PFE0570w-li